MIKKPLTYLILALVLALFSTPSWATSLTLTNGLKVIAIDGDTDGNVTVQVVDVGGTGTYQYGYYLNGGSAFSNIGPGSTSTFQGGDIIDFALYDGTTYYTLSGDLADPSYNAIMTFSNEVTVGSPQQPLTWSDPYYYNVNMTWTLPDVVNTNEIALNFLNNGNDGLAPYSAAVPEPTSLILMGMGLVGLGLFGRKKLKS